MVFFVVVFGDWLQQQCLCVLVKFCLGEKFVYIYCYWDGLQIFFYDGCVEIDFNNVENFICLIVLNRKNVLFVGYDEGGKVWGCIVLFIEIVKINGVEFFGYFKVIFEVIVSGYFQSCIDDFFSWNFKFLS